MSRRENEPDYDVVADEREADWRDVNIERYGPRLVPPMERLVQCKAIVVQMRSGKEFMALCNRVNCKGHGPSKRQDIRQK